MASVVLHNMLLQLKNGLTLEEDNKEAFSKKLSIKHSTGCVESPVHIQPKGCSYYNQQAKRDSTKV